MTILVYLLLALQICLLLGFTWMLRILSKLSARNTEMHKELYSDNLEIITSARKEAEKMVTKANKKALQIKEKTSFDEKEFEQLFDSEVQKLITQHSKSLVSTTGAFTKVYVSALEELKQNYIGTFQATAQSFDKQAASSLDEFKKMLEQETINLQDEIKGHVQKAYSEALTDIAGFKKQQMQQMQNHVNTLISSITAQVLNESLDTHKQETIITNALNQMEKFSEKN